MPKLMRSADELLVAIKHSCQGFSYIWNNEIAFRQYSVLAILLIPMALYLGGNSAEKMLMVFSVLLVLLVEVLNTALEVIVDRISIEEHRLSRAAKDLGSAAVLLSIVILVITWVIILFF